MDGYEFFRIRARNFPRISVVDTKGNYGSKQGSMRNKHITVYLGAHTFFHSATPSVCLMQKLVRTLYATLRISYRTAPPGVIISTVSPL